jgi:hypothetical protein
MKPSAKITVTSGPDRGKLYELIDEMVHIGTAADNELVLTDPTLNGRQASIVRRSGRHAIFSPLTEEIEVDGTRIPPDRWVWLPDTAHIKLSRRTALEFLSLQSPNDSSDGSDKNEGHEGEAEAPPAEMPPVRTVRLAPAVPRAEPAPEAGRRPEDTPRTKRAGGKRDPKRGEKPAPKVARFITDQAGDPLVKLGEDGHFPELTLLEGHDAAPVAVKSQKSNSLMLVAAFAASVGLSISMLFLDFESIGSSSQQKAVARKYIAAFYGGDAAALEPYQIALRQARRAYSQGNTTLERRRYRDVLKMLRAENKSPLVGLTVLDQTARQQLERLTLSDIKLLGDDFIDLKNDEKLARLLSILLASN